MTDRIPRILLVISSLSTGGAERVISELANAWAEKGWQIGVMTLADDAREHYLLHSDVQRISLDLLWESRSIWQNIAGNYRRSRLIRQKVYDFAPDIVISFIDQTNIRLLLAMAGSGIPVVVSERTDPRHYRLGWIWRLARRLLYPLASRLVVQTDSVAEWAGSFLPARKVQVIPNFVRKLPDVPQWDNRSDNRILAVGRLGREKGFDLLLKAYATAGLAGRGVQLTILGEGPERPSLERLVQELGLAEVVALPGLVTAPERWMSQCALFVLPSRFEGFPNALLEAMAMGCAIVATDCPSGPRALVKSGGNGLLVSNEDVHALSEALNRLMQNAELRRRFGEEASSVRVTFGREPILAQWEEIITDCMKNRRHE